MLFKQRSEAKEARGGGPAISASRIGIIESCLRKYAFIYEYRVPNPKGEPLYFKVGSAFSNARAKIDTGLPWDLPSDLPIVALKKLKAALRYYEENPPYKKRSVVCEIETTFSHDGEHYLGYLDARSTDGKIIYEWKYAVNAYDRLKAARQAAVYFYKFEDAEEFHLITFNKSKHKPKKAVKATKRNPDPQPETMNEFEERVYQSFVDAGVNKTFQRVVIPRDNKVVLQVLDGMNAKFRTLEQAKRDDFPPSYSQCSGTMKCDYSAVCEKYMGEPTSRLVELHRKETR